MKQKTVMTTPQEEAYNRLVGGQTKAAISRDMGVRRQTVIEWIGKEMWVRDQALKAILALNPNFKTEKLATLRK